jgi:hypothetical protein
MRALKVPHSHRMLEIIMLQDKMRMDKLASPSLSF